MPKKENNSDIKSKNQSMIDNTKDSLDSINGYKGRGNAGLEDGIVDTKRR